MRHPQVATLIIGQRYLRIDRHVEDYARLSPSIMREFLGYTVIGTTGQMPLLEQKAKQLAREIALISARKFDLARKTAARLVEEHDAAALIKQRACFLLAGDVVYTMAHAEPRPEPSTGELVKGSDLDLIVVGADLPEEVAQSLDAAIYQEKYRLLTNPAVREEIDYIVKDISRVREQLCCRQFKDLVAAKILDEAAFLYGSRPLFEQIKTLLEKEGVPARMRALKEKAVHNRRQAEAYLLLKNKESIAAEEFMKLFYTAEEREEIF